MVICAATMGIGTAAGGWRIIETLGAKMTRIVSWQGFVAEAAASTTIFISVDVRHSIVDHAHDHVVHRRRWRIEALQ